MVGLRHVTRYAKAFQRLRAEIEKYKASDHISTTEFLFNFIKNLEDMSRSLQF